MCEWRVHGVCVQCKKPGTSVFFVRFIYSASAGDRTAGETVPQL